MGNILVIGANGQLGCELVGILRDRYGRESVIASDIHVPKNSSDPFELLDIRVPGAYRAILNKYKIEQVYHLAAMLSAKGESKPLSAWKLNMESLITVLESGRDQVKKIYWPSSIAVFGSDTPKVSTPQNCIMNPTTIYGISKLAGEKWCEYYHQKYGVDVRSLRYPGLIGYKSQPGGGTTDYAVDVFWSAVKGQDYTSFLSPDTRLPMMYMQDAIKGTLQLMEAKSEDLSVRSSYNFSALSFTPEELFREISTEFPDINFLYKPDFRQEIAASWPESVDDTQARTDWGWTHQFDLKRMTKAMIEGLKTSRVGQ